MYPQLIIIAVGNPSRADDALGILLLERVAQAFPQVVALSDFQLQVEHALDLVQADLVLFIDAAIGLSQPYAFYAIQPQPDQAILSHALSPPAVLEVFQRIEHRPAPPSFILALRGHRFALGEPVSAEALSDLEAAWSFVQGLLATVSVDAWCRQSDTPCA